LNQAADLDPTLDVDQLRETAKCGEKYQQAIAELHRGHRNTGADLLREVAGRRPDFEDAAQRLEDLAAGGDGLLGQPAQTDAMVPAESPEEAGWKGRFTQLRTWFTATPEVIYEPVKGTEPAADEKGVFEKGRELLNDWLPRKDPAAPRAEVTPAQPVPPVLAPPKQDITSTGHARAETTGVSASAPKESTTATGSENSAASWCGSDTNTCGKRDRVAHLSNRA
jgi:hypothetical protein